MLKAREMLSGLYAGGRKKRGRGNGCETTCRSSKSGCGYPGDDPRNVGNFLHEPGAREIRHRRNAGRRQCPDECMGNGKRLYGCKRSNTKKIPKPKKPPWTNNWMPVKSARNNTTPVFLSWTPNSMLKKPSSKTNRLNVKRPCQLSMQ